MQIKQHGLNYQILVPAYETQTGRKFNKVVGRLSMSISDPDEAIRKLELQLIETQRKFEEQAINADLQLTDKDLQKIRTLFLKRESGRKNFLRAKYVENSPSMIVNAVAALVPDDGSAPEKAELLKTFKTICQAMVTDHFISEMFEACAAVAEKEIRLNDLPEEDAEKIFLAWISIKNSLEQQGYTAAWYRKYIEKKRDR